jgi:dihydrofolate reductase
MQQLNNYDAFVMGRVTYEKLFAHWARIAGDPYTDRINAMPKYVASRSLTEVGPDVTLLGSEAARALAELKEQPGKDLIKYGTGRFDETLVRERLIDELHLWYSPVVVGAGQRLFENVDTSSLDLRLIDERRLRNGSVMLAYAVR